MMKKVYATTAVHTLDVIQYGKYVHPKIGKNTEKRNTKMKRKQ